MGTVLVGSVVVAAVATPGTMRSVERPETTRTNLARRNVYTFIGWTLTSGPGPAAVIGGKHTGEDT